MAVVVVGVVAMGHGRLEQQVSALVHPIDFSDLYLPISNVYISRKAVTSQHFSSPYRFHLYLYLSINNVDKIMSKEAILHLPTVMRRKKFGCKSVQYVYLCQYLKVVVFMVMVVSVDRRAFGHNS